MKSVQTWLLILTHELGIIFQGVTSAAKLFVQRAFGVRKLKDAVSLLDDKVRAATVVGG